jgi:hypothetical protein
MSSVLRHLILEPARNILDRASCRPLNSHRLVSRLIITSSFGGSTSAPAPATRQSSRRAGPRPPRPLASEMPLPAPTCSCSNSFSMISLLHAGLVHAGLTFSRIVTAEATMSRVGAGDAGAVTGSLGAPQSRASPSRCLSRLEECSCSCFALGQTHSVRSTIINTFPFSRSVLVGSLSTDSLIRGGPGPDHRRGPTRVGLS